MEFGRYRVEKLLGSGAMGAVYLATDTRLDRQVALKVPRLSKVGAAGLLKRMEREARALAQLDHPQICQVYGFDVIGDIRFMVLEYVQGETLKSLLQRLGRKRKPAEAVAMIVQLARGLAVAHEKGVVHRDLKPENIMRRADGRLVIMDFGLNRQTRLAAEAAERTQNGTILGTPAYMSPEQASGKMDAVDQRTDIYALGVMLYEMLTGELPFTGSAFEIMGRKTVLPAPSPLGVNRELPPDLAAVCHRMLAQKTEDRYATCGEIVTALKDCDLAVRPTAVDSPPAAEPFSGDPLDFLRETEPGGRPRGGLTSAASPRVVGTGGRFSALRSTAAALSAWWRSLTMTWRVSLVGTASVIGVWLIVFVQGRRTELQSTSIHNSRLSVEGTPPASDKSSPASIASITSTRPTSRSPSGSLNSNLPSPQTKRGDVAGGFDKGHRLPLNEPVDLLPLVDLSDHVILGDWKRSAAGLTCGRRMDARFMVPVAVQGGYTLKCRFTRRSGIDCIGLIFPVGARQSGVYLDAWGSRLSGIHPIGGKSLPHLVGTSAASSQVSLTRIGMTQDLVVTVAADGTSSQISATVDGRVFSSWSGETSALSLVPSQALPNPLCVSVIVWNSDAEIHDLQLTLAEGGSGYKLDAADWRCPLAKVAAAPPLSVASKCVEHNGKHYLFSKTRLSLPDAQTLAREVEGRLLTISSSEEYEFITRQPRDIGVWMAGWRPAISTATWRDERNRPLRYLQHFSPGQPDAGRGIQWNLCEWTRPDFRGWDDIESGNTDLTACIEWGEEYAP